MELDYTDDDDTDPSALWPGDDLPIDADDLDDIADMVEGQTMSPSRGTYDDDLPGDDDVPVVSQSLVDSFLEADDDDIDELLADERVVRLLNSCGFFKLS